MSKVILVVEDDSFLRRLYRTTLVLAGYQVEEAGDGVEALRRLDHQPPDLIVLDLFLPALNGLAVRQEIAAHAHTRDMPIVVVTSSDIAVPDVPCVLRKPVSPDELVRSVRECLTEGTRGV